jgi:hypothetical protein
MMMTQHENTSIRKEGTGSVLRKIHCIKYQMQKRLPCAVWCADAQGLMLIQDTSNKSNWMQEGSSSIHINMQERSIEH